MATKSNPTPDDVADVLDAEIVDENDTGTDPGTELDVTTPVGADELERYVTTINELVVDDPEAIALKIAQRRLMATSVEELLAPQEVKSAADNLYRPLNVREVHFNRSRYEGGVTVYAVFDAVDEQTGEFGTYACGAADVLVQLFKLTEWGALPITVQVVPAKLPTQNGYFPLHLEMVAPPEPAF